jgi:hypothetical protein
MRLSLGSVILLLSLISVINICPNQKNIDFKIKRHYGFYQLNFLNKKNGINIGNIKVFYQKHEEGRYSLENNLESGADKINEENVIDLVKSYRYCIGCLPVTIIFGSIFTVTVPVGIPIMCTGGLTGFAMGLAVLIIGALCSVPFIICLIAGIYYYNKFGKQKNEIISQFDDIDKSAENDKINLVFSIKLQKV